MGCVARTHDGPRQRHIVLLIALQNRSHSVSKQTGSGSQKNCSMQNLTSNTLLAPYSAMILSRCDVICRAMAGVAIWQTAHQHQRKPHKPRKACGKRLRTRRSRVRAVRDRKSSRGPVVNAAGSDEALPVSLGLNLSMSTPGPSQNVWCSKMGRPRFHE